MDKPYVKNLIEELKSSSSSNVQETLLNIRSKVIVKKNGIHLFRDCGGLGQLIPHLRKPNERILDLTLSILGNCCLEKQSNIEVGQLHVAGPLIYVLKNVCRDSIVGRACRVIGNLAQLTSNAEDLHNHGVVSALITLIEHRDKNTSYPTLTMAVRAIRQLWVVTDKREEMLGMKSVRCVSILLITECESAGILKPKQHRDEPNEKELKKSQEELICGILKCLSYFSTYTTTQCGEQIQGDGRGYQCLVALTKTFESLALKCLINLCYLSPCRPSLGTAGFVECLVGILQKNSEVSFWPEGAARALSQLSGESVNRSRIRHCGGLPLLVAAARVNMHAMRAILQYVFDTMSFKMLVQGGLVPLLTDGLTAHLKTMEFEHYYKEDSSTKTNEEVKVTDVKETTEIVKEFPKYEKECLFLRRRGPLSNTSDDESKVVIERDNMIVGFIDAPDSDGSDDSENDDVTRKGIKRVRPKSPGTDRKKVQTKNKEWPTSVYWEPKSSEFPSTSQSCRIVKSPDHGPLSPFSDSNQSGFSPEYRYSSKRGKWDQSPESGVGTGESSSPYWTEFQWSPGSSGPTSPVCLNEDSSDSNISGRYSPVCSEHENEDNSQSGDIDTEDLDAAQMALDELVMDDTEGFLDSYDPLAEDDAFTVNVKSSRIACTLVLLFRLLHGACDGYGLPKEPVTNNLIELLTGKECLNALLDYVERSKKPIGRASKILTSLFRNALAVMNMLKHRVPLRLYKMSVTSRHPASRCQQCREIKKLSGQLMTHLTLLAESSYCLGELSYQLQRGPSDMKETLCLTLPYIVKAEKALKTLFIDCNGLTMLFGINTESDEDFNHFVTALVKLATNIRIKDPKVLENRFSEQVCVNYDPILDNLSTDEIVTFELDDSSTVRANRVFLCQNSDVFSAMLMGCFKESIENKVRIKDVSKPALEYLFTLLHFGINKPRCDIKVFPMADKLETNLEVLLLADRFLFDKLKGLLNSAIIQFQLTPQTIDKTYVWSLNEGMGFLCVESVAYLLTGKMNETERIRSFKSILNSEYKDQWLDDIKSILIRHLEQKK